MTDLERFRQLMESFHLRLERNLNFPDQFVFQLEPAVFGQGYDYPPVFVFREDGSFYQAGSIV
jgi:hypothetical protein